MTQIPRKIEFRCQNCKASYSLKKLASMKATCSACMHTTWQIHAEYDKQGLGGGDTGPGIDMTTVGLNIIGLSLLATTGAGFTYRGKQDDSEVRQKGGSVVDLYDIPRAVLLELCIPHDHSTLRIAQFIEQTEAEKHRQRMTERGATNCRNCQALFVPAANKPWTLVGACSKTCCVVLYKVDTYAQIEALVNESSADASRYMEQQKNEAQTIRMLCKCGHELKFPNMYKGTYRRCSNCSAKVLVPS